MKTKIIYMKNVATICCLLMFILINNNLFAQIIYTDIPDATPSATYPLDLNNDTIVDFLIQFDMANKVMCKPQNNNAYSGNLVGGVYLPWALSASTSICDTLATWYDANNPGTMASGTSIGNWVGVTDKYIALKLIVGPNTYYGWARLDIEATSSSFTIKDYAYQSTPNACIQSGQTNLSIQENIVHNNFSIYPNPFNSSATIQTNGQLNHATLTIYNSFGQAIKQVYNVSGQSVTISRDNLPSGLYFICLAEENKNITVEKLFIID